MTLSREEAVTELKRRNREETSSKYSPFNVFDEDTEKSEGTRFLEVLGKNAGVGALTALPNTLSFAGNIPTYLANIIGHLRDVPEFQNLEAPLPYASDYLNESINENTDNYFEPQNFSEKIARGVGEAVGGGKGAASAKATKLSPYKDYIAPQKLRDYLALGGLGAGLEIAEELAPDSTATKIALGLGGGLTGANAKNIFQLPYQAAKKLSPKSIAQEQLASLETIPASNVKQAGERLGIQLTPAEASGNPFIAAKQGALGTSPEGAQKLYGFAKQRLDQEGKAIENLYDDINPATGKAFAPDERVHNVANTIIQDKEQALIKKAQPFYEASYNKKIAPNKLTSLMNKDGNIESAVNKVLTDPKYRAEIEGFDPHSTKVLDLAKRVIDEKIATAQAQGKKDSVRLYTASKHRLTNTVKKFNPAYSKALKTYEQGSPEIEKLYDSPIGKIARREGITLKNVGKDIFDYKQTNPEVFNEVKSAIYKQDPDAWNAIVRQEMENTAQLHQGGQGSSFYKNILKDDKRYKVFHDALSNNKPAQKKLADMKLAFQNIINPVSAKTAAGQAKSSLNVPRSSGQFIKNYADNLIGGAYDNAAIDVILNPKWDEAFKTIDKIELPSVKREEIAKLLGAAARESEREVAQENQESAVEGFENELSAEEAQAELQRREQEEAQQQAPQAIQPQLEPQIQQNPVQGAIDTSANNAGLSPEFVQKVARVESGLNPNARNPNSTASGLFQFTDGTWKDMVNRYGVQEGISKEDKDNPFANAKMAGLYLRDNALALQNLLQREPTPGEVYGSHVLGLEGFKKLLSNYGNNTLAARVFPKEAKANKNLFFRKNRPLTIEQLYELFENKIALN